MIEKLIKVKKSINKRLDSIDKSINEINELLNSYAYLKEQTRKLKTKAEEEHKKFCILEIQSVQREEELKKEIRSLKRENKKLEKELCTNAITVDANSDNQEK